MKILTEPRTQWRRAITVDAAAILARAAAGLRTVRDRYKARRAARRWTSLSDHLLRDVGVHRDHIEARRLDIAWVGARNAEY